MKSMLTWVLALCGAAALAAVVPPRTLTYRGVLKTPNAGEEATVARLEFRIYDSGRPETALWGQQITVTVAADGEFYAELRDDAGVRLDGTTYAGLEIALAAIDQAVEIGVTPVGGEEMSRQRLTTSPRAARAYRAKAVEVISTDANIVVPDGAVRTFSMVAGNVTINSDKGMMLPRLCRLVSCPERIIGGEESRVKFYDLTTDRAAWPTALSAVTGEVTAPCDMIVTIDGEDGAFNAILPEGAKFVAPGEKAQIVADSEFGRLTNL